MRKTKLDAPANDCAHGDPSAGAMPRRSQTSIGWCRTGRAAGGTRGRRPSDDLLDLWLVQHERPRGLARGNPPGAARRRARLRRDLVRRASLLRLLLLSRQHPALVLPGAALHTRRPRYRRYHPAVERSPAGRREGLGARPVVQRSRPPRARARIGAPGVRGFPRHNG
jgi:hypothetical protein